MAKLTRPTETKIFGSTALAAELTPFGSSTPSTDINLILNSTEAQRGWGTIGANGFPPMEWFNALGYGLSYYNAYLMQQGIPEWTTLQNYYINSYAVGSDGKLYRSKTGISGTPNVGNNPTTDATEINWVESIKVDMPAVINGATAKTVPVGADKIGIYDSVSGLLRSVSFTAFWASLSGLFAPIASPAFTGTPIAPTATAGTNNTQVATTAYVDRKMILATAVASISGTSIDFTGIPSTAKKITVMFNGVSTNGASNYQIQIGSGAIVGTGYISTSSGSTATAQSTTGFLINNNLAAGTFLDGNVQLNTLGSNLWVESGISCAGVGNFACMSAGKLSLGGVLDRIRITTVNGTDAFDAGSINIMYEG